MFIRSLRAAFLGFLLALPPAATAASVPADIQRQIPGAWNVLSTARVSVSPVRDFYLVAMADKAESRFRSKPWISRSLWIFEQRPTNRYKFVGRNDNVILRPIDGGIDQCDPFEGRTIAVKGAYFTVENGIACGSHWTDYVTFRFDPKFNRFVFDNWRVETWYGNTSKDPNAEALVSDGVKVVRAKGRPVLFDKWTRSPGPTSRQCSIADVEACSAMWDLVDRKDFIDALRRFLGPGKASWTMENWDKTDQVLTTLAASSEDPTRIGDGLIRMGGCFPHNCPERAEVFFALGGEIRAVGLLYHDCSGKTCTGEEDYTLRILVREPSTVLIDHVKEWADDELRHETEQYGQFGPYKISRTVIDVLKG